MQAEPQLLSTEKEFVYSSFRLHTSGITPIGTPTLDEWLACWRFVTHAEESVHFWIGDLLRYAEAHFKADYQKLEALTGYNYHTLRRDKYLALRIPVERRRPHLDIAIHHEVAPLEEHLQEFLLNKVETEGLSVQQLRMEKHRLVHETARIVTPPSNPSLLLGDCREVLHSIADNSIDCILTDPPYGLAYVSEHKILPDKQLINDGEKEALDVLDEALALAKRKLKHNSHIYIFCSWKTDHLVKPLVAKYFTIKNILVWEKNNWTSGDLEGNYGQIHEFIIFAHKGRRHLNGRRDASVLHFNRVPENTPNRHPTEKPIALLEYLIEKSTQEGETVLDMFMGNGSTCLAAKNLKRNYVGIEIDQKWYEIAQSRLA
jgi:site-specific DNA-methyltransferase (adenine-specific)